MTAIAGVEYDGGVVIGGIRLARILVLAGCRLSLRRSGNQESGFSEVAVAGE